MIEKWQIILFILLFFVSVKMHLKDIVDSNFRVLPRQPNTRSTNYQCKHCPQQYAQHVTRMAKHLASCRGCPENQKLLVNKTLEKFGTTKSQKRKLDEAFDDDAASISSTLSTASTCSGTSGTSSASNFGNFKNMSEFVDR